MLLLIFEVGEMKSYFTNGKALHKAINREWELKQDEFFDKCKNDISAQVMAVCMLSLKTRFGFGKKRMRDFYDDVKGTIEIMDKDAIFNKSFSTIDCIKMIKDLYGIDLDEDFNKEE